MPAPKGNKYWTTRVKHGRDAIISDPVKLWESAIEYFEWCDKNPLIKLDFISSGPKAGTTVQLPTVRPYTQKGLCAFLSINSQYFNDLKERISIKKVEDVTQKDKDFTDVITRIEDIMWAQKVEWAAVGVFKENLIARITGVHDKVDVDHTTKGKEMPAPQTQILLLDAESMTEEQIDKYMAEHGRT